MVSRGKCHRGVKCKLQSADCKVKNGGAGELSAVRYQLSAGRKGRCKKGALKRGYLNGKLRNTNLAALRKDLLLSALILRSEHPKQLLLRYVDRYCRYPHTV